MKSLSAGCFSSLTDCEQGIVLHENKKKWDLWAFILKVTAKENTSAVFSLPFLVNIGQSTDDGKMEEHIPANLVYHLLNKNYYFTLWYVLKGLNYPLLIFKILLIPYEEIIPFCIRMEYLARSNLKKKALSFITSC